MTARFNLTLLLLLQASLLDFVTGLGLHKRDGQYFMNQDGITWDASCNDPNPKNEQETKRTAVQRAWVGGLELIDVTWTRFNTVTWPTIQKEELSLEEQLHINQQDPGYVQFFALDTSKDGTLQIRSTLQNLARQLNATRGTNDRDQATPVTIGCLNSFVHDGEDFCEGEQATTRSFPNEASSTINFCAEFFELPRFDELKIKSLDEIITAYHDEDYDGTDALTVMHEATHLWWIGPTNYGFEEDYGLLTCADEAWNCGNPIPGDPQVVMNADTFAWYGEYGYFVQKGVQDLWPPRHPQPAKLPVHNY